MDARAQIQEADRAGPAKPERVVAVPHGRRQYIDFTGVRGRHGGLHRHLEWLPSPTGALQAMKDRWPSPRELRRVSDASQPRIQDDIEC